MRIFKTRYFASPYYHPLRGGSEAIAGWGVWDHILSDWLIPDGFATKEEAELAAERLNKAQPNEEQVCTELNNAIANDWKCTAHGKRVGQAQCTLCEVD